MSKDFSHEMHHRANPQKELLIWDEEKIKSAKPQKVFIKPKKTCSHQNELLLFLKCISIRNISHGMKFPNKGNEIQIFETVINTTKYTNISF